MSLNFGRTDLATSIWGSYFTDIDIQVMKGSRVTIQLTIRSSNYVEVKTLSWQICTHSLHKFSCSSSEGLPLSNKIFDWDSHRLEFIRIPQILKKMCKDFDYFQIAIINWVKRVILFSLEWTIPFTKNGVMHKNCFMQRNQHGFIFLKFDTCTLNRYDKLFLFLLWIGIHMYTIMLLIHIIPLAY